MSTMIMTRPRPSVPAKVAPPDPFPENGPSRYPPHVKHFHSDVEPPEKSVRVAEPPESWQWYHAEAPDAGRGDPHPLEREFTQGRSRS